jgi:peroxiredoxin
MRDLITLERLRPSIEAQGVGVLAISQQTAAENRRARSAASIGLPLLRDIGGNVGFQFGIRWTLPIAARFVIDRNGLIVYSEINPDQTRGSDPRNMLPLVKHLHQRWLATR